VGDTAWFLFYAGRECVLTASWGLFGVKEAPNPRKYQRGDFDFSPLDTPLKRPGEGDCGPPPVGCLPGLSLRWIGGLHFVAGLRARAPGPPQSAAPVVHLYTKQIGNSDMKKTGEGKQVLGVGLGISLLNAFDSPGGNNISSFTQGLGELGIVQPRNLPVFSQSQTKIIFHTGHLATIIVIIISIVK